MQKIRCAGCHYRRPIAEGPGALWCCHYLLDTGEVRGMPVARCYRRKGTPYRPRNSGLAVGPWYSPWLRAPKTKREE